MGTITPKTEIPFYTEIIDQAERQDRQIVFGKDDLVMLFASEPGSKHPLRSSGCF